MRNLDFKSFAVLGIMKNLKKLGKTTPEHSLIDLAVILRIDAELLQFLDQIILEPG